MTTLKELRARRKGESGNPDLIARYVERMMTAEQA